MAGTPPDNFKISLHKPLDTTYEDTANHFSRLHVLKTNNQIRWLQTILRNGKTEHGDFVFNADRLVSLINELLKLRDNEKALRVRSIVPNMVIKCTFYGIIEQTNISLLISAYFVI